MLDQLNHTLGHTCVSSTRRSLSTISPANSCTGLQLTELFSNSKRLRVVRARQTLCYLAICHAALPLGRWPCGWGTTRQPSYATLQPENEP